MKRRKLLVAVIILATITTIGIYSCKKKDQDGGFPTLTVYTPGNVIATIHGRILSDAKTPLSGAIIQVGTSTTTTNLNGEFHLTNITTDRFSTFLKVTKDGYFSGGRTFIVNDKAVNYIEVALLPKTATYIFNGSSGGNITVSSGVSINFPANAIIDGSTGSSYSGQVVVNAYYLNPTAADFQNMIPGELRGITTSNEERGLQSFGMVSVELNGSSSSQKLKLAQGKAAELSFTIPAPLVSTAPTTIPLWYFDETKGMWKEEGSATKQGNKYVGQVSHFSFWNVDRPFPIVSFEARLIDQNNNPIVGSPIQIKKLSDSTVAYGYTDSSGKVSGFVPANEQLQLKVMTRCGVENYTQSIGPFANSVNLGDIKINLKATVGTITISGMALKCGTNLPLDSGIVQTSIDGSHYAVAINKGRYSITASRCSTNPVTVLLGISDNILHLQRDTLYNVTTGNITTTTKNICAIEQPNRVVAISSSNINYSLSGGQQNDSFDLQILPGAAVISSVKQDGRFYTSFTLKGDITAGNVLVESLIMTDANGKRYTGFGTAYIFDYSNYGFGGEVITGTVNGYVKDVNSSGYPVTLDFLLNAKNKFEKIPLTERDFLFPAKQSAVIYCNLLLHTYTYEKMAPTHFIILSFSYNTVCPAKSI